MYHFVILYTLFCCCSHAKIELQFSNTCVFSTPFHSFNGSTQTQQTQQTQTERLINTTLFIMMNDQFVIDKNEYKWTKEQQEASISHLSCKMDADKKQKLQHSLEEEGAKKRQVGQMETISEILSCCSTTSSMKSSGTENNPTPIETKQTKKELDLMKLKTVEVRKANENRACQRPMNRVKGKNEKAFMDHHFEKRRNHIKSLKEYYKIPPRAIICPKREATPPPAEEYKNEVIEVDEKGNVRIAKAGQKLVVNGPDGPIPTVTPDTWENDNDGLGYIWYDQTLLHISSKDRSRERPTIIPISKYSKFYVCETFVQQFHEELNGKIHRWRLSTLDLLLQVQNYGLYMEHVGGAQYKWANEIVPKVMAGINKMNHFSVAILNIKHLKLAVEGVDDDETADFVMRIANCSRFEILAVPYGFNDFEVWTRFDGDGKNKRAFGVKHV